MGDLIFGTGSADLGAAERLVYWMRVAEILSFDKYWNDPRFLKKKPDMRGSKMQRYGDNIYWTGGDGAYDQLNSFHSEEDGSLSLANRARDTGTTSNVLVGEEFAFFGKAARLIPPHLRFVVKKGPGHKCLFADHERTALEAWLETLPERGFVDEPGRW